MDVVVIDPPADLLAERSRLGLDRFDEVWNGEYHMVPPPTWEHQRTVLRFAAALMAVADPIGLEVVHEMGLIPDDEPGWNEFRVPDLLVFDPARAEQRGVVGAAALAVEVRSPGDESLRKLPFFDRLGVGEVLIIDRDTKTIRRWARGPAGLVESFGDVTGRHALDCLPVDVWTEGEMLIVVAEGARTEI